MAFHRWQLGLENYLRETGTLPYIAVAPGESKEVILSSLETLTDRGEDFLNSFDLGAVKFQVVALTLDGNPVRSASSGFGRTVSDAEKERLRELMRNE